MASGRIWARARSGSPCQTIGATRAACGSSAAPMHSTTSSRSPFSKSSSSGEPATRTSSWTSGLSLLNRASTPDSRVSAKSWTRPTRTGPTRASPVRATTARSFRARISRAWPSRVWPAGVSVRRRPSRWNSGVSTVSSRRFICRLSADWVTNTRSVAFSMEPESTMAVKLRSNSVGRLVAMRVAYEKL
jgi:hypothetical protein